MDKSPASHPFDWKTLESKYVLKDRWIGVLADTVQMPSGKILEPFYALDFPDYINIVGLTVDQQVILIQQYRYGVQRTLLELPAGTVDANDASPLVAARREMREETGYTSDRWISLPPISPNAANHRNLSHSFLALDMVLTDGQSLDDSEQIEVVLTPLDEVVDLLHAGAFISAPQTCALFFALHELKRQK